MIKITKKKFVIENNKKFWGINEIAERQFVDITKDVTFYDSEFHALAVLDSMPNGKVLPIKVTTILEFVL